MAVTRLGLYGGPRPPYGDFSGKAVPVVVTVTPGATMASPFAQRARREAELQHQRDFNRRLRAQREAERLAELPEDEQKRVVRRVFRRVSIEIPDPALIEEILPFAPTLADTLVLPPEEVVRFDLLARDLSAVAALHEALFRIQEEEAALEVVFALA